MGQPERGYSKRMMEDNPKNKVNKSNSEGVEWSPPLWAVFTAIGVLTVLIYGHTLGYPFHLDDEIFIYESQLIRDLANLWPPAGTRYIGNLSFAINFLLGGLDTSGYHVVNISIHLLASITLYLFVRDTFKTPFIKSIVVEKRATIAASSALITAFIFAAHPLGTQAVTYITQRFASMAALFYILTFFLYLRFRLRFRLLHGGEEEGTSPGARVYYILMLFSALLGMKTKEVTFTMPLMVLLYDLIFFTGGKESLGDRLKYLTPLLLTMLIIPFSEMDSTHEITGTTEEFSRGEYLITQFSVLVTYLRLLILPVGQVLDYEYPVYSSLLEPRAGISFIFISSLFLGGLYLLKKRSILRVTGFGITWFFVTISPESSIVPLKNLIFEHRTYLPSMGAFLAFSTLLIYLKDEGYIRWTGGLDLKRFTILLLLVTVIPLGITTYKRNTVWQSWEVLWSDVVDKQPLKSRGHEYLGRAYNREGRWEEAIGELKIALELDRFNQEAHNALGNSYFNTGRFKESIPHYREALRIKPEFIWVYYNLGSAYYKVGDRERAIRTFKEALEKSPKYLEVKVALAVIYRENGDTTGAKRELREVIALKEDYPWAYLPLAAILKEEERLKEALPLFKAFIRTVPEEYRDEREYARGEVESIEGAPEK